MNKIYVLLRAYEDERNPEDKLFLLEELQGELALEYAAIEPELQAGYAREIRSQRESYYNSIL